MPQDENRAGPPSFDDIRDVVFQTDSGGHWTYLNASWMSLTGYSCEESSGKSS